MVKKVTPKLMTELRPLVSDTPEAAFLIAPEFKQPPAMGKATLKRGG
jgi:hypothetical protein